MKLKKAVIIEQIQGDLKDTEDLISRLVRTALRVPEEEIIEYAEGCRDDCAEIGDYLRAYIWSRIIWIIEDSNHIIHNRTVDPT